MQYYAYHIIVRHANHLLLGRRLFQQFLVDMYCKIETERLHYLRREQKSLRADNCFNFRDSLLNSDCDPSNVGQRIVLPSTFTGGPRYIAICTSAPRMPSAMSECMVDLIYSFPRPQIQNGTLPTIPTAADRPYIVARIFHIKLPKTDESTEKWNIWRSSSEAVFCRISEGQASSQPHSSVALTKL